MLTTIRLFCIHAKCTSALTDKGWLGYVGCVKRAAMKKKQPLQAGCWLTMSCTVSNVSLTDASSSLSTLTISTVSQSINLTSYTMACVGPPSASYAAYRYTTIRVKRCTGQHHFTHEHAKKGTKKGEIL